MPLSRDSRPPRLSEMEHIHQFLQSIFSCDLESLPREVLTNRFTMLSNVLKPYALCFYKFKRQRKTLTKGPVWEHECLEEHGIIEYCGNSDDVGHGYRPSVDRAEAQNCSQHLAMARQLFKEGSYAGNISAMMDTITGDKRRNQRFYHNELCLQILHKRAKLCMREPKVNLETRCLNTSIRTAKILRLKMPFMEHFIQSFPDMYMIYYVRDPRGISSSRNGAIGPSKPRRWVEGVLRMCDEMSTDLAALRSLEVVYPGLFLTVRYEDLVTNTEQVLDVMYKHIRMEPLKEVADWLKESMSSSENKGVQKVNATKVVNSWKTRYKRVDIHYVTNHSTCNGLLRTLDYF